LVFPGPWCRSEEVAPRLIFLNVWVVWCVFLWFFGPSLPLERYKDVYPFRLPPTPSATALLVALTSPHPPGMRIQAYFFWVLEGLMNAHSPGPATLPLRFSRLSSFFSLRGRRHELCNLATTLFSVELLDSAYRYVFVSGLFPDHVFDSSPPPPSPFDRACRLPFFTIFLIFRSRTSELILVLDPVQSFSEGPDVVSPPRYGPFP